MSKATAQKIVKFFVVLFFLYLFLVSIKLMGHSLKGFGEGFAETLIQTTSNPFVGLFIGILATSVIQSSSTTTCIVVGMVAAGTLTIPNAVPLIMGANIGTSVTNTLVSLAHITRKEEFKRAFSGALVHDIFNISCVIILFPLEMATHFLARMAGTLSHLFVESPAFKFTSPIKIIVKPAVAFIESLFETYGMFSEVINFVIMLILSFIMLFTALFFIVYIMRSLVIGKTEMVMNKVLGRSGIIAITMGMIFTAIVQSSSVTTSLLIPLAGAGIITVEHIFPITLGANIGTTVTALLASLAGGEAGVTIALVHLLFNCVGILIFYPVRFMRNLILRSAHFLAQVATESRQYAVVYILCVFFGVPLMLIFLSKLF